MSGKRWFDLALVAMTAPVWVVGIGVLAAMVWVVDGRPVFFTQPRVGRGRHLFQIWKLRSMTLETAVEDRRPTRLGGWLRNRGLDETAQVWNVVLGDMSLVGPRPLTLADAERLVAAHPPFAARFDVPPGVTGLAQVCGARGPVLTAELDAHYAQTRTATGDLAILLRTVWINIVGKRRGMRQRASR
jgi:lipopolysaccharide/colanic/teichoic acid biosynthesis glycosyltransferase